MPIQREAHRAQQQEFDRMRPVVDATKRFHIQECSARPQPSPETCGIFQQHPLICGNDAKYCCCPDHRNENWLACQMATQSIEEPGMCQHENRTSSMYDQHKACTKRCPDRNGCPADIKAFRHQSCEQVLQSDLAKTRPKGKVSLKPIKVLLPTYAAWERWPAQ